MATAMAFPNQESKGRGKKLILNIDFSRDYLVKARFVLRNNPPALDKSKTTRVSYLPLTADAKGGVGVGFF